MKKKILSTLLMTALLTATLLTGCGSKETGSTKDNIQTSENQVAEIADKEYSPLEDIEWFWSISNHDLYTMMVNKEDVNPELFVGTISYDDGTMGSIKPDEVTLEQDGEQMLIGIEYRGDIFYYKANIQERWGDGEHLTEEEIETFKQEESKDDGSVNTVEADESTIRDHNYGVLGLLRSSTSDEDLRHKRENLSFYENLERLLDGSDVNIPMFSSEQEFYDFYDSYVEQGFLEPRGGYTEEELREFAKKREESTSDISINGTDLGAGSNERVIKENNNKLLVESIGATDENHARSNAIWYGSLERLFEVLKVDMPMFASEQEFYDLYDSYAFKPEDVAHFDNMEDLSKFLGSSFETTHVIPRDDNEYSKIITGQYSKISIEDAMKYLNGN